MITTRLPARPISPHLLQAARFAVVGMLGTLVDFGLFFAMQGLLHLPVLAANTLSYSAGILNNYTLHRVWTFAGQPRQNAVRQFASFLAISLVALAINNLVVVALKPMLTPYLPDALAALFSKGCATAAGLAWNYSANQRWTFATGKVRHIHAASANQPAR